MNSLVLLALILGSFFAGFGLIYIFKFEIIPRIYARMGYIHVTRVKANGRLETFFAKPEVTYVSEDGKKVKKIGIKRKNEFLEFIDDPKYYVYDNKGVKHVFYDSANNIVSIEHNEKVVTELEKGLVDVIIMRTWNAARTHFLKQNKMQNYAIFIAAGAAILSLLVVWGMQKRLDQILANIETIKSLVTVTHSNVIANTTIVPS